MKVKHIQRLQKFIFIICFFNFLGHDCFNFNMLFSYRNLKYNNYQYGLYESRIYSAIGSIPSNTTNIEVTDDNTNNDEIDDDFDNEFYMPGLFGTSESNSIYPISKSSQKINRILPSDFKFQDLKVNDPLFLDMPWPTKASEESSAFARHFQWKRKLSDGERKYLFLFFHYEN